MPSCQAFNCTNEKGKCSKSFFIIPDPEKSAEKKKLRSESSTKKRQQAQVFQIRNYIYVGTQ